MLFNSKKKKAEEAFYLVHSYIDDAAQRFNGSFLNGYRNSLITDCRAIMIHFARFHFNVEETILEMYLRGDEQPEKQKRLENIYFLLKDHMDEPESQEYYNKMGLMAMSFSRIAANPYNHVLDLRYGQLLYSLKRLFGDYIELSSNSEHLSADQAIYFFFVEEEPTIKGIVEKVHALFNVRNG